jgi:hypothetical protein
MARRKTDAERGPFGAWAYNTRVLLDRSVEEIVSMLPTTYHPATLRKVEGGTPTGSRPPARMWRELGALYAKLAKAGNTDIDAQPRLNPEPADGEPADLASALRDLTVELTAWRTERQGLIDQVNRLDAQVAELVADRDGPENSTPTTPVAPVATTEPDQ